VGDEYALGLVQRTAKLRDLGTAGDLEDRSQGEVAVVVGATGVWVPFGATFSMRLFPVSAT
jgi:hypothetical protein